MDTLFWIWVVLAAALIVGEILTQTFFLGAFGIGAAVAAALNAVGATSSWQVAALILVALPLLWLARRATESSKDGNAVPVAAERLIGHTGVVVHALRPNASGGIVRVAREDWSAEAEGDRAVAEGAEVEVLRVEGVRLIVRPRSK